MKVIKDKYWVPCAKDTRSPMLWGTNTISFFFRQQIERIIKHRGCGRLKTLDICFNAAIREVPRRILEMAEQKITEFSYLMHWTATTTGVFSIYFSTNNIDYFKLKILVAILLITRLSVSLIPNPPMRALMTVMKKTIMRMTLFNVSAVDWDSELF